jgi:hypothetical protein
MALASGDITRYTSGDASSYTRGYIMSSTADKTRETRLRRMAERQGLKLVKSRRRDRRAVDYGEYYLSDLNTNALLAGDYHSLPDLDAVERWLTTTDYSIDIDTPDRLEIGPAASPSDLAYPLAHALILIEKHGSPRPPFKVRADQDGNTRDLTSAEQEAFTTALEHALDRLQTPTKRAG